MAHAVAGLPENITSRSHSRDRSRSCSRSRHHTPEPLLASPALDSPSRPLSQTPLHKAASKSPRAMSRSLSAAWQSPRATAVKTPHAVSRSPRPVGRSAAAIANAASSRETKPMPAEDKDQQRGRSASLARLQRSHRSAIATTQKGSTSLVEECTYQTGQTKAEHQESQHVRAGSDGLELAVTALQSGGMLRRSLSGCAGLELLPSDSSHGDLRLEDCSLQRPASSPPMSMLSRAPFDISGQELHGLSCAGLPFTHGPQRQPTLQQQHQQQQQQPQQQQQQAGLQPQPHQDEQQPGLRAQQQHQEWVMQQQWNQQQQQHHQRQQQLQAACGGLQQPGVISLHGQHQHRTAWASGPGVVQDNFGSLSAGAPHSMLVHPQHQQQHQQPQQAAVADAQLALLPMAMRIQPDHRHSAAAALHATVGKHAATAAEYKGRRIVPGANTGSLWGHSKQLDSCVIQNQEVLHQTAHEHAALGQQQPSHGPIPLMVQQSARLASALDCAHVVDEALQVQKLNVTPHKPPRQLSGNPFAEPAQVHPPTEHVTAQTHHAQHVPASDHDAGLSHYAEDTPTPVASAQPLGSHDSQLIAEHRHDACCMSAAASTSGNAAASSQRHRQVDNTQQPSEATGMAEPSPQNGGWPTPTASVGSLAGPSSVGGPQGQVAGDQIGRLLLSDLEIEAVAADAEACLLELQVRQLFTS